MKTLTGLVLGSAAGLAAMTGTHAADLPVKAKPVEYVKICTLVRARLLLHSRHRHVHSHRRTGPRRGVVSQPRQRRSVVVRRRRSRHADARSRRFLHARALVPERRHAHAHLVRYVAHFLGGASRTRDRSRSWRCDVRHQPRYRLRAMGRLHHRPHRCLVLRQPLGVWLQVGGYRILWLVGFIAADVSLPPIRTRSATASPPRCRWRTTSIRSAATTTAPMLCRFSASAHRRSTRAAATPGPRSSVSCGSIRPGAASTSRAT